MIVVIRPGEEAILIRAQTADGKALFLAGTRTAKPDGPKALSPGNETDPPNTV